MKVFVVHDPQGSINSFGIASSRLEGQVRLQPPPGEQVAEVEMPEIQGIEGGVEQDLERILGILKKSRVDVTGEKPRLVQR